MPGIAGRVVKRVDKQPRLRLSKPLLDLLLEAATTNIQRPVEPSPVTPAFGSPIPTIQGPDILQPRPIRPNTYASFLKDYVDPVSPTSNLRDHPILSGIASDWLDTSLGGSQQPRLRSLLIIEGEHSLREYRRSELQRMRLHNTYGWLDLASPQESPPPEVLVAVARAAPSSNTSFASISLGLNNPGHPAYYQTNLLPNGVQFRQNQHLTTLPPSTHAILRNIILPIETPQSTTVPPQPPAPDDHPLDHDLAHLHRLQTTPHTKSQLLNFFNTRFFLPPSDPSLFWRCDNRPMRRSTVPFRTDAPTRLAKPVPDMLYGYTLDAFDTVHEGRATEMGEANKFGLLWPFLAVTFRGEGDDYLPAGNECVGAVVGCVKVAERVNEALRRRGVDTCAGDDGGVGVVNSCAFGFNVSAREAELYVAFWGEKGEQEEEGWYFVQKVRDFDLEDVGELVKMGRYVRSILGWGTGGRMEDIEVGLNVLGGMRDRGW